MVGLLSWVMRQGCFGCAQPDCTARLRSRLDDYQSKISLPYEESGTRVAAMPHAQYDNRLIVPAVAQDIRPSAKGHTDFTPLRLIIHPTPQVRKLQEPLRPKLHGADSAFCGSGGPFAQEIIQTLDIGRRFREPDEPHSASAGWAACAAS